MGGVPGRGHRSRARRRPLGSAAARRRPHGIVRGGSVAAARGLGSGQGGRRRHIGPPPPGPRLAGLRHGRGLPLHPRSGRTHAARPPGTARHGRRLVRSPAHRAGPGIGGGRVPLRSALLAGPTAYPEHGADVRCLGVRDAGRPHTSHGVAGRRAGPRRSPPGRCVRHPQPLPGRGAPVERPGRRVLGDVRGRRRGLCGDGLPRGRPAELRRTVDGDPRGRRPDAAAHGDRRAGRAQARDDLRRTLNSRC